MKLSFVAFFFISVIIISVLGQNPNSQQNESQSISATAKNGPMPIFNCSRSTCGPNPMMIIRTCPNGRSAHPLCAWLSDRQRCGYRPPDCNYPDPPMQTIPQFLTTRNDRDQSLSRSNFAPSKYSQEFQKFMFVLITVSYTHLTLPTIRLV